MNPIQLKMNATVDSYKNFIQRIGIKTVRQGKNLLIIWENLHPSKKQKNKDEISHVIRPQI